MQRALTGMTGLLLLLTATGCSTGAGGGTTSPDGQRYHDSAGWTIEVPPGWHIVQFHDSKDGITSAGTQLSNVPLPRPSLIPGFPIQVTYRVLPARGVDLIIATDTDRIAHGHVTVPPLPALNGRYWTLGSVLGGSPYMETLWFRANRTTFVASAQIGPRATNGDLKAIAATVKSLR